MIAGGTRAWNLLSCIDCHLKLTVLKLCEHVTYAGLNKFKKRRFRSTVNLLTGATEVHPDLQQVRKLAPLFLPCSKTLNVNLGWEI